ncbi:hypothetical protein [Chryseobacterium sp. POL2]|uniref:hypothetical protein n=1 Tax=Chryseobacterium sp. POL2 TaxID=2713414 RepID=UPI001E2E250A|nr:hypothetical protein [Chryseobacterium sp. POL2]
MINRLLIVSLFFFFVNFKSQAIQAQVLEAYPANQFFYQNGVADFFEDFQKMMLEDNIKACENPEEKYKIGFIVYPDKKVKYVKDFDTLSIKNNQCAYDIIKKVFPKLKNWNPAVYNNTIVPAVASAEINPSDILDYEFKTSPAGVKMFTNRNLTEPQYPGGLSKFRIDVANVLMKIVSKKSMQDGTYFFKIKFDVDELGSIQNLSIIEANYQLSTSQVEQLFRNIKKLNKFTSATKKGVPKKSFYTLPITLSFE